MVLGEGNSRKKIPLPCGWCLRSPDSLVFVLMELRSAISFLEIRQGPSRVSLLVADELRGGKHVTPNTGPSPWK